MAESIIIVDGDVIQVAINPPTIVPQLAAPVALVATGFITIDGKAVCVEGDELPPSLRSPLLYIKPPYATPGTGTLSITLEDANKTATASDNGKKMLLKGSTFRVKFQVQVPAQQPTPGGPVPDATPSYSGTAQFISMDILATAE